MARKKANTKYDSQYLKKGGTKPAKNRCCFISAEKNRPFAILYCNERDRLTLETKAISVGNFVRKNGKEDNTCKVTKNS